MALSKLERRVRIKHRVRKVVFGTATRPRLSVFRSNKEIYAQLVDDNTGTTLVSVSSRDKEIEATGSKLEIAKVVGKNIAEKAIKAGVEGVSFDRNGFLYHGRVKALADAAREAGLKF
ncbi:50S ribosomal protein L18 [Lutibacter sp. HS1-25]|uniref:50S ribosomal protein L18 n=1 Tax=Lutibacter sp. HS1-25 TaxID=2485000 RepID=UPI001010B469|nr:50S ribosomal protein L18 [Lutibacter sp. HS1-25]RXP58578.1 50S ribosomal protein L18 [Lutibacter sp. HS1-25]